MNKLSFSWDLTVNYLDGEVIYRESEYSIDFITKSKDELSKLMGKMGQTSLIIDTLQIEIDIQTGNFLYPWGFFPHSCWNESKLNLPQMQAGKVFIKEHNLLCGISVKLPNFKNISILKDSSSGWICCGQPHVGHAITIEFTKNVAVTMDSEKIFSIWLKPKVVI